MIFPRLVSVLIFNIPGNSLSIDKSASKVITFALCILLRFWFVRHKHLNRLFYCLRWKYTRYILFFYSMKWGINLFIFRWKTIQHFLERKKLMCFPHAPTRLTISREFLPRDAETTTRSAMIFHLTWLFQIID